MHRIRIQTALSVLLFFGMFSGAAVGQEVAKQLESELVDSWLATVDGDQRPRTLKILSVTQKSEGVFSLNAEFGFPNSKLPSAVAEIVETGKERKLTITANSGAKISAIQQRDGSFLGTFTTQKGESKPTTIIRISDEEMGKLAANSSIAGMIKKPTADVPAACAAYVGLWKGQWKTIVAWLLVSEVDAKCVAKYAQLSRPRPPGRLNVAEIKDGVLSFPDNVPGYFLQFKRNGDALDVLQFNPSKGSPDDFSTTYRKVEQ